MSLKRYDKNFKIEVIRRVKEQGQKVPVLARELTIYKWIGEFKQDAENAFPGSGNLKPEDAEIGRLKRENETLKEEIEILKKTTAFFAKDLK